MCGIAGILKKNIISEKNYKDLLKKMTDSIIHRGPDDEGREFFDDCFLGFRRLAIVDLSEDGHQPMFSETNNECIVFNGEIYGYRELKDDLTDYHFKSNTDTEVILAMYQKFGDKLPKHLNGMFAFSIWDTEKKELFCARDRFGEKPFYYAFGRNGEFIFASEIKAILATGLVDVTLREEAVFYFLRHAYVNSAQTIYNEISVLPPAHQLKYKDGEIKIEQYWNFPEENNKLSFEEAQNKFKALLENAVRKQMVADVKVGAFLSGGLDSGTLVALASDTQKNLSTLGFAYSGDWNEMPQAREIAEKYETDHHEVFLNEQEISKILEEVIPQLDEPLGDTAVPATYTICKKARENMTVVITGNAGDELFGGYNWYKKEWEILKQRNQKKGNLTFLKVGSQLSEMLNQKELNEKFQKKILVNKYRDIVKYQQENVHSFFSPEEIKSLGIKNKNFEHSYSFPLDPDNLNTCLKMDLTNILPGDYMVKDDRLAMLNSIELRTPFLDKDLVEFCTKLPSEMKVDGTQTKKILRETFGEKLTPNILTKKKQGFGAPVDKWLQMPEMQKLTDKYLRDKDSKVFEILDFKEVQKFLNYSYKHWLLLVFGIWINSKEV